MLIRQVLMEILSSTMSIEMLYENACKNWRLIVVHWVENRKKYENDVMFFTRFFFAVTSTISVSGVIVIVQISFLPDLEMIAV